MCVSSLSTSWRSPGLSHKQDVCERERESEQCVCELSEYLLEKSRVVSQARCVCERERVRS